LEVSMVRSTITNIFVASAAGRRKVTNSFKKELELRRDAQSSSRQCRYAVPTICRTQRSVDTLSELHTA
jgi:hypothetical protein